MHGRPVGEGSGPVSDLSTNVGAGSSPVHRPGSSMREGNAGELSGNSVRGSATGNVLSGPVSDASVGPVTEHHAVSGTGTMSDASAGAVKKDIDRPLGETISQPLRELGPLQEQLRAIQPLPRMTPRPSEQQAEAEAAARAETEAPEAGTDEENEAVEPAQDETEGVAPEAPEAAAGEAPEAAEAGAEEAPSEPPQPASAQFEAEASDTEAAPEAQETPLAPEVEQ